MIDIKGIDKAKLLQALFNASHQQGAGFLHVEGNRAMTLEDAQEIVKEQTYFDYLRGRVLKVDISGDTFEEWLYDRDNGEGAALEVVNNLKEGESE